MLLELSTTDSHDTQLTVACRICSHVGLNPLLQEEELADSESQRPLDLAWCPTCSLVQITETVPDVLFRSYACFSSLSDTTVNHAKSISARLQQTQQLGPDSLVIEISSNDPARNRARVVESERGGRAISEYFGLDLALKLARKGQQADLILAKNVLTQVADLNSVAAGFAVLLKPEGIACIEVPYLKDLMNPSNVDAFDHEHLCYFSLTALSQLFGQRGLEIVDAERLPSHGGSLRIVVANSGVMSVQPAVRDLLADEAMWVRNRDSYQSFGQRMEHLRREFVEPLPSQKSDGKRKNAA